MSCIRTALLVVRARRLADDLRRVCAPQHRAGRAPHVRRARSAHAQGGVVKGGRPIIIVKKKAHAHAGHHGGAWKVAYADFVTAMMAFFMVMWILGMDQHAAEFHRGLLLEPGRIQEGLLGGQDAAVVGRLAGAGADHAAQADQPQDRRRRVEDDRRPHQVAAQGSRAGVDRRSYRDHRDENRTSHRARRRLERPGVLRAGVSGDDADDEADARDRVARARAAAQSARHRRTHGRRAVRGALLQLGAVDRSRERRAPRARRRRAEQLRVSSKCAGSPIASCGIRRIRSTRATGGSRSSCRSRPISTATRRRRRHRGRRGLRGPRRRLPRGLLVSSASPSMHSVAHCRASM